MDKETLKKTQLKPKGSLSKAPLWPKMFGIACLRLAISQDIDGLSLAEMTAVSQETPQAALCNTTFLPGAAEEQPALPWTGNRWQKEKDKAFATYSTANNSVIPLITFRPFALSSSQNLLACSEILLFPFIF